VVLRRERDSRITGNATRDDDDQEVFPSHVGMDRDGPIVLSAAVRLARQECRAPCGRGDKARRS